MIQGCLGPDTLSSLSGNINTAEVCLLQGSSYGAAFSPGDIWQCLQTFSFTTTGWWWWWVLLASRGWQPGMWLMSFSAWDRPPPTRTPAPRTVVQPQMPVGLRVRSPVVASTELSYLSRFHCFFLKDLLGGKEKPAQPKT